MPNNPNTKKILVDYPDWHWNTCRLWGRRACTLIISLKRVQFWVEAQTSKDFSNFSLKTFLKPFLIFPGRDWGWLMILIEKPVLYVAQAGHRTLLCVQHTTHVSWTVWYKDLNRWMGVILFMFICSYASCYKVGYRYVVLLDSVQNW